MLLLPKPIAFEWDDHNKEKIWKKHRVSMTECEEAFFDQNKKLLKDTLHSQKEERYLLLGKTKNHRLLFIVFTMRKRNVRMISARPLNKKEHHLYEKAD